MELVINDRKIPVERLHTITRYAEKSGFNYSTIMYGIANGRFEKIEISGIAFVIEPETGIDKRKRKAGRKPKVKE